MSKKIILPSIIILLLSFGNFAQNVGINSTGATPNASAMLDIVSTTTGLLIPRLALTATNSNAPVGASVTTSLLVYNTATASTGSTAVYPGFYYWDGVKWVAFGGSGGKDWSLTGNGGTTAGTNFIGTTDAIDWVIKTNNTEKVRVLSGGNVGIGTPIPAAKLSFNDLNDGTNGADGITWYNPAPTSYGIYRSAGAWAGPNYQQLTQSWQTGVIIDGGSLYGLSGTLLQPTAGNVGIGQNVKGAYNLEVNGSFGFGDGTVGSYRSRTESRADAGQIASQSGFFQTSAPAPAADWPVGANSWWHLIDCRHSNNGNNYALQISGSFFDQDLYYRKTNGSATTAWSKLLSSTTGWALLGNAGTVAATNFVGTTDAIDLVFRTTNAERMRIMTGTGRVGIGTTAPSYLLETAGDIYANGGWFRVSGNQGYYFESWGGGWQMTDATWLRTYNAKSVWTSTGLLGTDGGLTAGYGGTTPPVGGALIAGITGIGTTTPATSNLGVTGVTKMNLVGTSVAGGDVGDFTNNSTVGAGFIFGNNSASNNYNALEGVTYGTYSGLFGLHIPTTGGGNGVYGKTNSTNASAYGVYAAWGGGSSYGLVVTGPSWCSSGVWSGSDRKLKTNIAPIESALAKLLQLNGYTYDYKPEFTAKYGFNTGKNTGVMADELEKVFPELTKDTYIPAMSDGKTAQGKKDEGMDIKSVNYSGLIPVLIEAVKEQQKQIEELKQRVTELEKRK